MELPIAIVAVFWAAGSYFIYLFLSRFLTSRRNAAKARELKCEDPPFQKNRYPLGIDQVIRAVNADKAKLFPLDQIQTFISHFALGELGAEGRKACLESHKLSNRLSRHASRLSGGLWLSNKSCQKSC